MTLDRNAPSASGAPATIPSEGIENGPSELFGPVSEEFGVALHGEGSFLDGAARRRSGFFVSTLSHIIAGRDDVGSGSVVLVPSNEAV